MCRGYTYSADTHDKVKASCYGHGQLVAPTKCLSPHFVMVWRMDNPYQGREVGT